MRLEGRYQQNFLQSGFVTHTNVFIHVLMLMTFDAGTKPADGEADGECTAHHLAEDSLETIKRGNEEC